MGLAPAKRALVTGAGQRLGQAIAIALAQDGYDVAIHYRSSEAGAEKTAQKVRAEGRHAVLVQADLASEADVSSLVRKAEDRLGGPLGVLINNASVFVDDDAASHTRDDWDLHMDVNLRAPIRLSQAFFKSLPEGERGAIINMIDQRVWKLNPNFFTYTLSKSALWSATKTLAQAFAPNVRVNGIGPGPTLQNERQSADDFRKQVEATLTERGANPAEIVKALRFLLESDAVTGQMIAVDGGQHLIWQTPDIIDVIE
ncbi:SDR family oxidoreductase [Ponticaulis sp.]|uniref:SDR family oxidoreductase n=1 Tax=Ponticaulis sp. TaxID=2020902 RepID=UPI000B64A1BF|nr:SDR family oxidoreductase [Ponticaulis sp.]MAI88873.1 short chain dehydrogenase [Ponticaulis sp.]OUY01564.1 MAG: short chain dehydrogenase [Hyphomonadaceae bacterium TMED5]|tara:strand:- start:3004 stop:3774 length:771 start_codon:yes stop_codon:yes gene_type:complete